MKTNVRRNSGPVATGSSICSLWLAQRLTGEKSPICCGDQNSGESPTFIGSGESIENEGCFVLTIESLSIN